jgi:hypothetical protein
VLVVEIGDSRWRDLQCGRRSTDFAKRVLSLVGSKIAAAIGIFSKLDTNSETR